VVVADEEELAAAAIGTRSIDEILGIKADKDEAEEGEIEADQDEIFEESEQSLSESAESDNVTESDDDEESLA
jgi:stalled ribosome rescue protein Dom34